MSPAETLASRHRLVLGLIAVQPRQDGSHTWTPVQIATPVVVGTVLILAFAAFLIWRRRNRPSTVDSNPICTLEPLWRVLRLGRYVRHRVVRTHATVSLDDSLPSPTSPTHPYSHLRSLSLTPLQPQSQQSQPSTRLQTRADSADSSTPLADLSHCRCTHRRSGDTDDDGDGDFEHCHLHRRHYGFSSSNTAPSSSTVSSANMTTRTWATAPTRWTHSLARLAGFGPRKVRSSEPYVGWRIDGGAGGTELGHAEMGLEGGNSAQPGREEDLGDGAGRPIEVDGVMMIGQFSLSTSETNTITTTHAST